MAIDDWELAGVHGLRKYVWHLLETELGWKTSDYGGLTPIITPEQEPELMAFSKPFLVYTYARANTSNLYALETEIAAFTVYATSDRDIVKVVNLLGAKLNKRDETAQELNDFVDSLDGRYNEFDYKTIRVVGAQGAQPVDQEGGRKDGYISVSLTYTHYDNNGRSIRF